MTHMQVAAPKPKAIRRAHPGQGVPMWHASKWPKQRSCVENGEKGLGRDHLYSVAALTNATGAVVERYRYDTYGNRTTLAPDGITTRAVSSYNQQIGFTGRYLDKETGLYYFRTRMHSPTLGIFISRDPQYLDGYGLYRAYFPPNFLDTYGMNCVGHQAKFLHTENVTAGPVPAGAIGPIPLWSKIDHKDGLEVELSGKKCTDCCKSQGNELKSAYAGSATVSGIFETRLEWYARGGPFSAGLFAAGKGSSYGTGSFEMDCCTMKGNMTLNGGGKGQLEGGGFVRLEVNIWKLKVTAGGEASIGGELGLGFGMVCDQDYCTMSPVLTARGFATAKVYAAAEVGWYTFEYARTITGSVGGEFGGGSLKTVSPLRKLCQK